MLALCLMLAKTYYAQNYAGIIGLGLKMVIRKELYFRIFDKKVYHHYQFPHTDAARMAAVVGMHLKHHIFDILHLVCQHWQYQQNYQYDSKASLSIPLCTCWCLVLFVHCSVALYSGSVLHGLSSLLITFLLFHSCIYQDLYTGHSMSYGTLLLLFQSSPDKLLLGCNIFSCSSCLLSGSSI